MKRHQRISPTAPSGRTENISRIDRGDIALVDQRIRNVEADRDAWRAAKNDHVDSLDRTEELAPSRDATADTSSHCYTLRLVGHHPEPGPNASDTVDRLGGDVIGSAKGMLLFTSSARVALAIAHELPNWLASPETHAATAARVNGAKTNRAPSAETNRPDSDLHHAGQDRTFIDVNIASELQDWSEALGVTPHQLKLAVASAGGHADAVENYIKAEQGAARASRRRT